MFDFGDFPTLHTDRLTLRQIVHADAPGVFRIRGDYEVTRLNSGAAYTSMEQAHELIAVMKMNYDDKSVVRWGITHKTDETNVNANVIPDVIGICGYNHWHRTDRRGSIGYDLARAHWRQGIMREAISAILTFGFDQMNLNRVEADSSAENVASIALLKSLGFQYEGKQREQYYDNDTFHDLELYSLLLTEWQRGLGAFTVG